MVDVKILDDAQLRAAHSLFRASLHHAPAPDDIWERAKETFVPDRALGAFEDGRLVGTAYSFPLPMVVPGGTVLPTAGVTRVGVRADHTRRGVLSALMREQLTTVDAAGEPLASLRASEYPIYGRFGYGVASRGRTVRVDARRAAMHPGAPTGGAVRLLEPDEIDTTMPALYGRLQGRRPGFMERGDAYWRMAALHRHASDQPARAAVHAGPDGDDGYLVYNTENVGQRGDDWDMRLTIEDLHASTPEATAALWRFACRVDLVNSVQGWLRPLDEHVDLLLVDARACRTIEVLDENWLRLVDVEAALRARSWAGAEPVVLGVTDALLPANSGGYRLTPDGAERTDDRPQLALTVAELGRLYLGDLPPSALAGAGRLTVHDAAALPAADALFATGTAPWSGTFF